MAFHGYVTPKGRERIIAREQTGSRPSLRQELNAAYSAQMLKARAVRGSRNPADVAMRRKAEAYMADLAEQLVILDAIEYGYIKPAPGCGRAS